MALSTTNDPKVVIIGAGPAGLMAAEVLSQKGVQVDVYDAMPSAGRKFLMAGKGGMNITHSEPFPSFLDHYGSRHEQIKPLLESFSPIALIEWIHGLGLSTFIGTSGRVFPSDMKAAPLLRAWLHRLRENGVCFHMRHQWTGWDEAGELSFTTAEGSIKLCASAVVLALGGGSWPQLGSNAAWVPFLLQRGVDIAPFRPSNCGFDVGWSDHFRNRFAGTPLKTVVISFIDSYGKLHRKSGDVIITQGGIEGGAIYSLSALLRDEIATKGVATISLDLTPGKAFERVLAEVQYPRGSRSISSHLQSRVGLKGVQTGLLRECGDQSTFADTKKLAQTIKTLTLRLKAPRPLEEAISSAGGVKFEAIDQYLMLHTIPGVFCAGEMLDWEAPTGGYLLSACFASGFVAGTGVLKWLKNDG